MENHLQFKIFKLSTEQYFQYLDSCRFAVQDRFLSWSWLDDGEINVDRNWTQMAGSVSGKKNNNQELLYV